MSDDRKTARRLAPMVPFLLLAAHQVPDAFGFTVLAVMAVMTATLVLHCWRRDIDHPWEEERRMYSEQKPSVEEK